MKHEYSMFINGRSEPAVRKLIQLMEEQARLSTRGERRMWKLEWSEGFLTVRFERIVDWRHFRGAFVNRNWEFVSKHQFRVYQ
jgi:hypothetical protein